MIADPGQGTPNRLLFAGPPTAPLGRYYSSVLREHISSTSHPGGTYVLEGVLGLVENGPVVGTHPIYRCRFGGDHFTSLLSSCEGQVVIGLIGFIYTSPPGVPNHAVRRCMVRRSLEHFHSFEVNCEGHINEGVIGYLLNS